MLLINLWMRNDDHKPLQGGGGSKNAGRSINSNGVGFIPTSFRAFSRIVSSGASTVASTVKSAASAIVEREWDSGHDQVQWAGFDRLELEGGISRLVLLLGYRHGFQVWDVEEANNVHNLVSRQEGPVSFLQVLPKPLASKHSEDKFTSSRPMLIICADGCFFRDANSQDRLSKPCNGTIPHGHDLPQGSSVPTALWFYSLRSQSYVHHLKFKSAIHVVRCSSRVVAVLQTAQIHCFDAVTLERDYTIFTYPVTVGCGSGSIGFGPLAVGPRWIAYSGSPIDVSNSGRVSPQKLAPSSSFPGPASNGSLVAHYAKESSKQIAASIVTLGDIGRKKLSRYYSDFLPDGNNSQTGSARMRVLGTVNGQLYDADSVGMVIVRDTVQKTLITQFRAHKSPISSLCFDPSGTLLVTASVQGHNINVFQLIPGCSGNSFGADSGASYIHLYRLQRGVTNAVIQDISFSRDSQWIMISSSRGTSHLFSISPFGGSVGFHSADSCSRSSGSGMLPRRTSVCCPPNSGLQVFHQENTSASAPPITLSVMSRIRSGSNGWRHTVSGAAAAATGRVNSLPGIIAAAFHNYGCGDMHTETSFPKITGHLLVFSSPGCLVQHAFRVSSGQDSLTALNGVGMVYESGPESDARVIVEPIRRWNVSNKQNRKEREENIDIYGENGNSESSKVFPEGMEKKKSTCADARVTVVKDKTAFDERHHMYISEAELQMHAPWIPLWAKAEMYFQSLLAGGINMDAVGPVGGEIEIERIPVRMIEARSKELVPVFDCQVPKFLQGRSLALNGNNVGQLLFQKSGVSEDYKFTWTSNSSSSESIADSDNLMTERSSDSEEHRGTM